MLDTANAMAELSSSKDSIEELKNKYDEPAAKVEDELASLKAKLGK